MKIVILAGGFPSTISDGNIGIPKPMAEIGGQPILWHIMKHFSSYGFHEFIICGGYKVDMLKEYFKDFYIYQSDITVDLRSNTIEIHKKVTEDWKVSVVDTGIHSSTARRVSLIEKYIEDEDFIVTYGDCLSDVNPADMVEYHRKHGKIVTMMVANPTGRNSALEIDGEGNYKGNRISDLTNQSWVNACTYVMNRKAFGYLLGNYSLEQQFLSSMIERNQVITYKHAGFWSPIETKRDKQQLENDWIAGCAPWKSWEDMGNK